MIKRKLIPSRVEGFTLIELLVAVAIFSGLIIIVLGSIARSSLTLASIDSLREKSQATRKIIDQISNDWQYVYNRNLTLKFSSSSTQDQGITSGYYSSGDGRRLIMVLKFPRQYNLTVKDYQISSDLKVITLSEFRAVCENNNSLYLYQDPTICPRLVSIPLGPVLADRFSLADNSPDYRSYFQAATPTPNQTGKLKIELTIRPAVYQASQSCADLPKGTCYKLSTTLSQGMGR